MDVLRRVVREFQQIVVEATGRPFPQDPRTQLFAAIHAVFASWNSERAIAYRRQEHIPRRPRHRRQRDGDGLRQPRPELGHRAWPSPATRDRERGVYGDYLVDAQGEDVVSGDHNTIPLAELERLDKHSFDELLGYMDRLEHHYRDLCDIEFTIERGKLWMLQTRVGKRTAAAAFVIACQLVDEGLIDLDEALLRVTGAQLPAHVPVVRRVRRGRAGGDRRRRLPGAAVGQIVLELGGRPGRDRSP